MAKSPLKLPKLLSGLVTQSLEHISREVFSKYASSITQLVEKSSGVYALYDEEELYYVGRATQLRRRVKQQALIAMINYQKGDATTPTGNGNKIIVHICNDIGAWGKGFVVALSKKWKAPEKEYKAWAKSGKQFQLGEVQFVQVEPDTWVSLHFIQ